MNFEILSEQEAWNRYGLFDYWSVDSFSFGRNNFLVFDSGVTVEGDWDTNALCEEQAVAGIVINGNLNVAGCVQLGEFLVLVKGNLVADHLRIDHKEVYVTGNCAVAGLVHGGWQHGRFTVEKEIRAQFLIYEFERAAFGQIHPATITIDHDFNSGCRGDYTYFWHQLTDVFLSEVYEFYPDGEFSGLNLDVLMQKLTKHEPVMKPK